MKAVRVGGWGEYEGQEVGSSSALWRNLKKTSVPG